MKKYKVGYTQGTFDLFHVGHLNLLENASKQCDILIVGVNSDALVQEYKNKTPIIPEQDRCRIVKSLKVVTQAIVVDTLDKLEIHKSIKFDAIFIGDDWINNDRWIKTKEDLSKIEVDTIFLTHTDGISSSILKEKIKK